MAYSNQKIPESEKNRIEKKMKEGTAKLIERAGTGKTLTLAELQASLIRVYDFPEHENLQAKETDNERTEND